MSVRTYSVYSLDPRPFWPTRKGLGNNLSWKCLEHWNAAVGVDEGKNATPANQPTNDGK